MKKILMALMAISMATSHAQDIKYGIKGGVNLSKISNSFPFIGFDKKIHHKFSFNMGVFTEFHLSIFSKNLYGEIGLNYSKNGAVVKEFKLEVETVEPNDPKFQNIKIPKTIISINQINIPLLLKYRVVNISNDLYINIKGGVYTGFISRIKVKSAIKNGAYTGFISEMKVKLEEREYVKRNNLIDFGTSIGFELNLSRGLFLDFGYNFGLLAINNKSEHLDKYFPSKNVSKNRVIQISLGIRF